MYRLLFLLLVLFSVCFAGCSMQSSLVAQYNDISDTNCTLAVLPLADYVGYNDFQKVLQTTLFSSFAVQGTCEPVMPEDVWQAMKDVGVIATRKLTPREIYYGYKRTVSTPQTFSLNKEMLRQIGDILGADYVIRGQIIELRDVKQTYNVLQRGILPVVYDLGARIVFGNAESEKYDLFQKMAVASLAGTAVGNNANIPFKHKRYATFDIASSGHPAFSVVTQAVKSLGGITNADIWNSVFWSTALTGSAFLASKGGRAPVVDLLVTLAVQDVKTGKLIFISSYHSVVEPKSVFTPFDKTKILTDLAQDIAQRFADDFTIPDN